MITRKRQGSDAGLTVSSPRPTQKTGASFAKAPVCCCSGKRLCVNARIIPQFLEALDLQLDNFRISFDDAPQIFSLSLSYPRLSPLPTASQPKPGNECRPYVNPCHLLTFPS